MKFASSLVILATSFVGSVHGANQEERRTQGEMGNWAITSPTTSTTDPVVYNATSGMFSVAYAYGAAGRPTIQIYTLPVGETPASIGTNVTNACMSRGGVFQGDFTTSISWLADQSFESTGIAGTESEYKFAVAPAVINATANIFEDGTNPNDDDTLLFCILFGKTDDFQATGTVDPSNTSTYGPVVTFVEIAVNVTFKYDGTFELSDFQTKAMDALNDNEEQSFAVEVVRCPNAPAIYDQLTQIPVCVCPKLTNPDAPLVSIASVQNLTFAAVDTNGPSQQVLLGGNPMTGAVAVTCNPDGTNNAVTNKCCQVDTLLNSAFFPPPTVNGAPAALSLGLTGTAFIQLGGDLDGTFAAGEANGDPNTRRLVRATIKSDRALQTSELVESEFDSVVDIVVVPDKAENSAAGTTMSRLAIAGAVGAALLI